MKTILLAILGGFLGGAVYDIIFRTKAPKKPNMKDEIIDENHFVYHGTMYVAKENDTRLCAGCAFDGEDCIPRPGIDRPSCSCLVRSDGKDVVFVEEGGEP